MLPMDGKYLYLLRHAKASSDTSTLADHERPLAPRGRRAAALLAEHFDRSDIRPEMILCSSATRTRQTLEPIATSMGLAERVHVDPGLYGATAEEVLSRLRAVDGQVTSVLVVGHNPGLQDLAVALAGDDRETVGRLRWHFPPGTLVTVTAGDTWRQLSPATAQVTSVIIPDQLPT